DVRLPHCRVDLRAPASVPAERCRGRTAIARAAHTHGDLARRGHDAPVVSAVPDVHAMVTALVRTGTDEPLQLLVEDELNGRLHRYTDARVEVEEEVFMRRKHEVVRVRTKRSCWLLHERCLLGQQPGGSLVFSCRPRKRLLHNYRDTTRGKVLWRASFPNSQSASR